MTSDSRAIQHIYMNADTFVRQTNIRELLALIMGPGLTVVNGDAHRRQRRVMQPAFSLPHLKALFPIFIHHAGKVASFAYHVPTYSEINRCSFRLQLRKR
jgi:cytochrome P450